MAMAAQASRPVTSFPSPGPSAIVAARAEDRQKLLRVCRLLRMALGVSRHPGGSLADLREPPPAWIVRALCLTAEDILKGIDRPGVAKALEALGQRLALGALMQLEEDALRLRLDWGDPGEERPGARST